MLPGNNDNSRIFHNILEIYQRCKRNGEWAKVYLETQNGQEFVTISVCSSAGAAGVEKTKKKSPSQLRRDRERHSAYLERQHQAAAAKPVTPTPTCKEATIAAGWSKLRKLRKRRRVKRKRIVKPAVQKQHAINQLL